MAEVKGIRLGCPKCGRLLVQLSFTGMILAPQSTLFAHCGPCGVLISLLAAFPDLFHKATSHELLQSTIPYNLQQPQEPSEG